MEALLSYIHVLLQHLFQGGLIHNSQGRKGLVPMSGHSESDSEAVVEVPLTASINFPVPWLGYNHFEKLLNFLLH